MPQGIIGDGDDGAAAAAGPAGDGGVFRLPSPQCSQQRAAAGFPCPNDAQGAEADAREPAPARHGAGDRPMMNDGDSSPVVAPSKAVPLYPRGYDRLPDFPQRRDTFSVKNAAFRAQIEQTAEEIVCGGGAGRRRAGTVDDEDDDALQQLAADQDAGRRGGGGRHPFRRILLSRGSAVLSMLVVLTAVAVTSQQLIDKHDFRAVRASAGARPLSSPALL